MYAQATKSQDSYCRLVKNVILLNISTVIEPQIALVYV